MKFNIDDFISSVPVLRLFAKNLALNAGIAFVIQDFLIPLYSNYIFDIVSVLLTVGILSFFYWIFIFKKKSKNYAHFSLQISLVCLIFAVMVGALSSVSKAFSSDDRGILASNVDFVADLQDNTNIYDEKISSLGRDISRVSSQFSELQSDLSSLSEQIASQISDDGSVIDNEEFLEKISTLIDEKNLQASGEPNSEESDEVVQLRKNLDIATELLRQVTLANVNLQKKEVDNTPTFDDLSADSIVFYIGELKNDINDLRNFSLQLLANTALADTRSELNTFKNETKKDLEDLKEFTSLEIEEIKKIAEEILNVERKGGNNRANNNLSKELKDLSKAIEKGNVNQTYSFDDDYLEEIVETYQQIVEKIDNNPIQNDIKEIKEELANLSSTGGSSSSLPDPSNNISVPTGSQNLDNSGISELKYYIVELMKDQNEIRQIVKDLRDILEEKSDD
ncbi:hypothetical protein OA159_00605 [Cytophagia bacterium]|nr:hypothetical protein [Cytophagia bacterium]